MKPEKSTKFWLGQANKRRNWAVPVNIANLSARLSPNGGYWLSPGPPGEKSGHPGSGSGKCRARYLSENGTASLQFASASLPDHPISGAICQRVNRASRLLPARCDKVAAIYDKKVLHLVNPVVAIDHRLLGIHTHAASSHQMTGNREIIDRLCPDSLRTRSFQNLTAALLEEAQRLQIVRVILECHTERGKSPGVFQFRI